MKYRLFKDGNLIGNINGDIQLCKGDTVILDDFTGIYKISNRIISLNPIENANYDVANSIDLELTLIGAVVLP